MSNENMKAKEIANMLRLIAKVIEKHPEILNEFDNTTKMKVTNIDAQNIFQIYKDGGETVLRDYLEKLDILTLRKIVRELGLDSSKLAEKWKNKERLLQFLIERIGNRSEKGRVFKNYP